MLESRSWRHFATWLMFSLVVLAVLPAPTTCAQGAAQAATEDATAEEGEATEAATEADSADDAAAHPPKQSQLYWIIHTSGWIGGILLLISIYFVAIVVQLFVELRDDVIMPPHLLEECHKHLANKDYQAVYKTARENTSELGQLLATGLAAFSSGLSESREAIDRLGEAQTVELEKKISMLAVIGSLGPMIGLLGTLKGMISSFSVIAMSDTQLKASEVAGGISEALLITFEGVALSVPAIYFYAMFKNRVMTLSVRAINTADEFMRKVHQVANSRTTPTANS